MKKLLLALFITFVFPSQVFGHSLGQPPFLKINGEFTDYYPVPTTSLSEFMLPNDNSKQTYFLINKEINFEIDSATVPIPPEVLEKSRFIWEFGDGATAEGIFVKHNYLKAGTYFVNLKIDSEKGSAGGQTLQITAVNIVPTEDYKLPKAVIEVNGKKSEDPLTDIIDVDFEENQTFSAAASEGGSSPITEYFWDLGDTQNAVGSKNIYSYQNNPYTVFPVLRIKTADGFIADAYVQIKDESAFDESFIDYKNRYSLITLGVIFAASVALAAFLTWLISKTWLRKLNK